MINNGIILAGGSGTRLFPITNSMNKHMIPVYNRHMIEYPINTLKELGCQNVTIVIGGDQTGFGQIISYLQDGKNFGMNFNFIFQPQPLGIAHGINICRKQVGHANFAVCLGDNYFQNRVTLSPGDYSAQMVLAKHPELKRFGVATIKDGDVIKIQEKPKIIDDTAENYAITGCYMFDELYFDYFTQIKPSARGEFEICEILECYQNDNLLAHSLYDGFWSDLGTFDSIYNVSSLIRNAL